MVAELTARNGQAIERVPFENYVDLPALHATALKDMLTSARLYRRRRDKPRADSDTLRQGRAIHTAVLEPARFLADYVLWTGKARKGKTWDAFKAEHAHKTILTRQQYDTAQWVAEAVREHDIAGEYLNERKAQRELTLRWVHQRTGLQCKARIDFLGSFMIDLKGTRNPAAAKFCADSGRFGYALQMAFYGDGEACVFGKLPPQKIIAAQNVEPFDVVVYNVAEKAQRIGSEQAEKAIDLVAACIASNKWPGLAPDKEIDLVLPPWAAPDYDEDGPDESQPIEDAAF
jgi:hypothetical protein